MIRQVVAQWLRNIAVTWQAGIQSAGLDALTSRQESELLDEHINWALEPPKPNSDR